MGLHVDELVSIYCRYDLYCLVSFRLVVVIEKDFLIVAEEIKSYVAMPFLLLLISGHITPDKSLVSSGIVTYATFGNHLASL